ncbi:hypothetical protein COI97_23085 [Bacillus cereus]|nr:hypothetical protein COI97_23085 [Bacillus cereus]
MCLTFRVQFKTQKDPSTRTRPLRTWRILMSSFICELINFYFIVKSYYFYIISISFSKTILSLHQKNKSKIDNSFSILLLLLLIIFIWIVPYHLNLKNITVLKT